MLGHGAGSNISRKLGGRDVESARIFASTSFFLSLLCGSLMGILGLVLQEPLMRLLGSTDSILPYAKEYSTWILLAAPAMASSCVMNNILRYEGKAVFAMMGLAFGGILNIFGDAVLIFGLDMGVRGAGISTAVSQYVGAAILISPFLREKIQSRISIKYFTHSRKDITNIIAVGFPSLMRQGLNSVSVMVLNLCSAVYGDAAIAAMSIVSRVINFLFCVALGIGQGFQPVSAFNYGAGKYSRVREGFWFSIRSSLVVLSISAVAGFFCSGWIIALFRDDPEVIRVGVRALRAQCLSSYLSVRKYAVSEYWKKRNGNFFVDDTKRHCIYPYFVDLQPCIWSAWNSDFPGDGRYYISSNYASFRCIFFSFHAGGQCRELITVHRTSGFLKFYL